MPTSSGRGKVDVDLTDLNGLRGIAALWIMMFHVVIYSSGIDFLGSTLMPLFFLLSGFSLSIGYVGTLNHSSNSLQDLEPEDLNPKHQPAEVSSQIPINSRSPLIKYYYNRFIRVIPVCYITSLEAIPITLAGYGNLNPKNQYQLISSIIQNIIPTTTWTFLVVGQPLDGPAWTIATLCFFWIFFPFLLRFYDKQTDQELLNTIVRCYWVQLSIIVPVSFLFIILFGYEAGFWWTTGTPYCRLPVFIMGMCGGILCARYAKDDLQMPWFGESGSFLPWGFWAWCTCCCYPSATQTGCYEHNISFAVDFKRSCERQAMWLLGLTVALIVISNNVKMHILANLWFQAVNVFAQLDIIVALCKAKGTSRCSSVLRHPVMLWFGELSMSIYLVHWPLIFYVCWISQKRTLEWPLSMDCNSYAAANTTEYDSCVENLAHFTKARIMPLWGMAVVPPVAIALAAALYYGVEEPVRKYLK